eukprot:GABV01000143.1.p1 GENE.GABV01000143.1~~GABV01000143.1.p1  ORF type:complete len:538 (+),score=120.86 GABV01000143.1:214-1614(+)
MANKRKHLKNAHPRAIPSAQTSPTAAAQQPNVSFAAVAAAQPKSQTLGRGASLANRRGSVNNSTRRASKQLAVTAAPPRGRSRTPQDTLFCQEPGCTKPFRSQRALEMHTRDRHGKTLKSSVPASRAARMASGQEPAITDLASGDILSDTSSETSSHASSVPTPPMAACVAPANNVLEALKSLPAPREIRRPVFRHPEDQLLASRFSWVTHRSMRVYDVNSEQMAKQTLSILLCSPIIAVEACGSAVREGRRGRIDMLAVGVLMRAETDMCVFLFDMASMGPKLIEWGLGSIFEDRAFTKICFDVRGLADALSWKFGVRVKEILDVQLLHLVFQQQIGHDTAWLTEFRDVVDWHLAEVVPGEVDRVCRTAPLADDVQGWTRQEDGEWDPDALLIAAYRAVLLHCLYELLWEDRDPKVSIKEPFRNPIRRFIDKKWNGAFRESKETVAVFGAPDQKMAAPRWFGHFF